MTNDSESGAQSGSPTPPTAGDSPRSEESASQAAGLTPESSEAEARGAPAVPRSLEVAASFCWRALVVAAAALAVLFLVSKLLLVVMPLFVALLATAVLRPPADWLRERGVSDALAALIVMASALLVGAGLLTLIVPPFVDQVSEVGDNLRGGVQRAGNWLLEGPLDLTESELQSYLDDVERTISENRDTIAGGVVGGARAVGELLSGLALAIVMTFFLIKDGDRIAAWFVGVFPARRRHDAAEVGRRSWETLSGYLRGVSIVALVDAVFIGLALAIVGVPAVLPLAVFTFLAAFVPIVGAVVMGAVAALVALVTNGPLDAAIILAAVVAVQQLEGNVLQPLVVGRAIDLHPLAILLAVTTGIILGGIPGAIVAAPLLAILVRIASYLRDPDREADSVDEEPDEVDPAQRPALAD